MARLSRSAIAVVTVAISLCLCAGAGAAVITVGSPTTTGVSSATVGNPATLLNLALGEPGANLKSPVTGAIVRWHVTGFTGGPWRLRVLTPLGGLGYTGSGASAPAVPTSVATQTFTTNLPIKAGQTIAVDNTNSSDQIGLIAAAAGAYGYFVPPLGEGVSSNAVGPFPGAQFTFNAEVLPVPTIAAVTPGSGSLKGGSIVTVVGSDFSEVKGVRFGATPATIFTVNSESVITAVAPASATPGPVSVAVTTAAGTASSAQPFTYTACKVPNLLGKKLKGAKKRIRKAGCKVGRVTKPKGVTSKSGVVVKQSPKAGKVLAPRTKVNLRLG
jgi:IPT/TIG domain/PASTA domain